LNASVKGTNTHTWECISRGADHKISKNIFLPFWFFITWDS
jgi:hypothetical protein